MGALLSVTSGIHPDLTGRENVYLYGAVLGMRRKISHQRFDEIVEFAGLTDAIDRQVKFFSLGMQMRLGFSIAAFLEPDILLVDEVLSVGDANFQQKCIQRIEEVVRQGTTLVYVSHDLTSVEATCEQSMWLADARVQAAGPTREVAALYRSSVQEDASVATSNDGVVRVLKSSIAGPDGGQVLSLEDAEVRMTLNSPESVEADLFVGISLGTAFPIFITKHHGLFPSGDFEVTCRLHNIPLPKGGYSVWTAMTSFGKWADNSLAPVEAGRLLRRLRPGRPRPAGRGHGGGPAVCGHDVGHRLTTPAPARQGGLWEEGTTLHRSGQSSGAYAERPHPLVASRRSDQTRDSRRSTRPTSLPLPEGRAACPWCGNARRAAGPHSP